MAKERVLRTKGKGSKLSFKQMTYLENKLLLEAQGKGNDAEAARRAGYAHANIAAVKLNSHPLIKREIEQRRAAMLKPVKLDREWVLAQYKKWAEAPALLAKFKIVEADGAIRWDFSGATQEELALITELATDYYTDGKGKGAREVKKFKIGMVDPKSAVDAIARVQGLNNDKLQVNGELTMVERLQQGRLRAAGQKAG